MTDILLEKYRIEERLGGGAFGDVYRVTHLELLVSRALKVLRRDAPGLGSQEFNNIEARFRLEGQLGAMLNTPTPHPNLLQVHNLHAAEDLLVLEMEYAPGGDLSKRIQAAKTSGQPYPVATALQVAVDVANALASLHANDIVHRDLKPANILFDNLGHAKLADFGLAQVPGGPSQRSQLSQPSPHPGTPGYKSPEQENSGSYLTPPSDVYALGVVLFEMLTGRLYTSQRPGTPASKFRGDLPAGLDELLARMLSENPKQRPWDGEEAASLLRNLQAGLLAEEAQRQAAQQAHLAQAESEKQAELARQEAAARAEALAQEQALARQKEEIQAQAEAQARKADEQARLEVARKAQAEVQAREQSRKEEEARKQAEQKKRVEPVPPAAGKGFLARNWGWIALAVLLLGGCYVILPFAIANLAFSAPFAGAAYTRPADGMTMAYVPGATFTMGSADITDAAPHQVTLSAYWIDETDVTNAEYAKCVATGICTEPSNKSSATRSSYYGNSLFDNYPVIYVNWSQAETYCEWAGVKLPTEAQWELAARGTDNRTYPWGAAIDKSYANYNQDVRDTTAVWSYQKGHSPYGADDMAGNVWQWVADWYGAYGYSPTSNPTGPASGNYRVLRGGSWYDGNYDLRSAYRNDNDPSNTFNNIGFRCARSN